MTTAVPETAVGVRWTAMAVILAAATAVSALVCLLSLVAAVLFAANVLPQSLCSRKDYAPSWGVFEVAACLILVGVGHRLRHRRRRYDAEPANRVRWPLQVLVAAFLGGVALLLGYETFAVGQPDLLFPITWYVRCLNTYPVFPVPAIPAAAAMTASLMAGHWLWCHRTAAEDEDSAP